MKKSLIKVWAINKENLHLLNHTEENYLKDRATDKNRNVGGQWTHLHNTRLDWLNVLTHKPLLINILNQTSKRILVFLERQQGRRKSFYTFGLSKYIMRLIIEPKY